MVNECCLIELKCTCGENWSKPLQEDTLVQIVVQILYTILWYVDRYGLDYVAEWNFESWNEPNNRDFDTLQFTIQGRTTITGLSLYP